MTSYTADLESATLRHRLKPYISPPRTNFPTTTIASKFHKPFTLIYRFTCITLSLYLLRRVGVWRRVRGIGVKRGWWRLGIVCSGAIELIKAIMELYHGHYHHRTLSYVSYRQTTHLTLLLFIIASISFHKALWPVYGWNSLWIQTVFGYGVMLQGLLVVGTRVQHAVVAVLWLWLWWEGGMW